MLEQACKDLDSLVDYCCKQSERNCRTKEDCVKFWDSYENLTVRTYCLTLCGRSCYFKQYLTRKNSGGE